MNSYIFSIIGVVLISSLLTAIIPEGKTTAIVKNMAKLLCLFVIISPILQFFHKTGVAVSKKNYQAILDDSVIELDEEFIKYYSESTILYVEDV